MKINHSKSDVNSSLINLRENKIKSKAGQSANKLLVIYLVLSIIIILTLPYILTQFSILDLTHTGGIGDTIGGIMGPFIAIIVGWLTYKAFWEQYQANQRQVEANNKQDKDLQIERFENKFYNMVEIHRQNVIEIAGISDKQSGRRLFISLFYELRFIYKISEHFFSTDEQKEKISKLTKQGKLDNEEIYNIAYLVFFFGISSNSKYLIDSALNSNYKEIVLDLIKYLESLQEEWHKGNIHSISLRTRSGLIKLETSYLPFNGHISILSHYIRHLFLIIKFIHEQLIFNDDAKYNYASIVRSQLSPHEQLFLYYNAISVLGSPWIKKGDDLINKYCLIKSIPTDLADFYINPEEIYNEKNIDGRVMFEWTEIKERIQNLIIL